MENREDEPTDVTTSELTIHYSRKSTRRGGILAHLVRAVPSVLKFLFRRFSLLIVVALSVAHTARDTTFVQPLSTGTGGYRWVLLRGGGSVELDANTDVDILYQPEQRLVVVKKGGRASVSSDSTTELPTRVFGDAPLSAAVNGTLVMDQREKNHTRVIALSGSAQLRPFSSAAYTLTCADRPGTRCGALPGVLRQDEQLEVPDKSPNTARWESIHSIDAREHATAWRKGYIQLDEATLEEAAREFERYYNVKFVIDPVFDQVPLSGRFSADPLTSRSNRVLDPAESLCNSLRVMIPYARVTLSKTSSGRQTIISVQRRTH